MADELQLGRNVRDLRRIRGLSQEELAGQCELSVSTIRKIEQGGSARMETLHNLAQRLQVETSQLFQNGSANPHCLPSTLNAPPCYVLAALDAAGYKVTRQT
jgi:transcriptional regulator with XRE-family HTH domain